MSHSVIKPVLFGVILLIGHYFQGIKSSLFSAARSGNYLLFSEIPLINLFKQSYDDKVFLCQAILKKLKKKLKGALMLTKNLV